MILMQLKLKNLFMIKVAPNKTPKNFVMMCLSPDQKLIYVQSDFNFDNAFFVSIKFLGRNYCK